MKIYMRFSIIFLFIFSCFSCSDPDSHFYDDNNNNNNK